MATTTDMIDRSSRGRLAQIYYTNGQGEEGLIPLHNDLFTIGSHVDNDLSLRHQHIAPHHAEVRFDGRDFIFVDKASHSGSFFDTERIAEKPLSRGDSIRLGTEEDSASLTFLLPTTNALPDEFDATSLPFNGLSTVSIISLKQLNDISEQIRQSRNRAELFETLQTTLAFVFPTARIVISTEEQISHLPNEFLLRLLLTVNPSSQTACYIRRPLCNFNTEETEFLRAVCHQAAAWLDNLSLAEQRQRTFDSMIKALALSLDARDEMTAGHSARVANYSMATARHLGLNEKEQKLIYYAALLHDYGKIGVRDDVLCKPAQLTEDEYEHIKQHPTFTFHILSRINFGPEMAEIPRIASSHHERPDGKGYPRGLKGSEIHIGALIIAVTDFFDALTATRHYRQPLPPDEVIPLLEEGRDTKFDGHVLDAFRRYYEAEYRPRYFRRASQIHQGVARS